MKTLVTLKTQVQYPLQSIDSVILMSVAQAALQYDTNHRCGSEQTWRNHHSHGPRSAQRKGENGQRRCHDCLLNIRASLNHCISLHRALEMKSKDFQMNEHTMAGIT